MECVTAGPFISLFYDREEVPEAAANHIAGCLACRARLRAYAAISSEMHILAAAESLTSGKACAPPVLTPRRRWWSTLQKGMRIPRAAVAAFALILVILSAGWIRTAAQNKVVTKFRLELQDSIRPASATMGESLSGKRSQLLGIGETPAVSYSYWGDAKRGYEGLGSIVEVLGIHPEAVALRVRLKRFTQYIDPDQAGREMKKVKPQDITYTPGQPMNILVEGGDPVVLEGSIVSEGNGRVVPANVMSLLPGLDEMVVTMPILVRDGKDIVISSMNSGTRSDCAKGKHEKCGVALYVPREGLFFISMQPLEGATEGKAALSQVYFQDEGHSYTLCSGIPITGGDQPRSIWALHLKDYLPSQHGHSRSEDAMISLGSGDLTSFLRPDPHSAR